MSRITNEVLATKIDSIQEDILEVKTHLKEINGKTSDHGIVITKLDTTQKTHTKYFAWQWTIIGLIIATVISKIMGLL